MKKQTGKTKLLERAKELSKSIYAGQSFVEVSLALEMAQLLKNIVEKLELTAKTCRQACFCPPGIVPCIHYGELPTPCDDCWQEWLNS